MGLFRGKMPFEVAFKYNNKIPNPNEIWETSKSTRMGLPMFWTHLWAGRIMLDGCESLNVFGFIRRLFPVFIAVTNPGAKSDTQAHNLTVRPARRQGAPNLNILWECVILNRFVKTDYPAFGGYRS